MLGRSVVRLAQQTLTLSGWVQIPTPLPLKVYSMEKYESVIQVLRHEKLIPETKFQLQEQHIEAYVDCYNSIFGKKDGLRRKNEKSLARKIAGLNLLNENFRLGAKFNEMEAGIVYLVKNPVYPDHLKVGMTINLKSRLEQYQTSDPFRKFSVHAYDFVLNRKHKEEQILKHPDAVTETGEWLLKESALRLFQLIVKHP